MRRRTRTSGLRNIRHSSLINPTLQELQYSTLRYIELAPKFEKSLLACPADNCMKKMDIAQRKEKVKQDSTFRGLMREKNINLDEKDEDLSTVYANLFVGIALQINCKAITEVEANKSYEVVSLSC
ncbi:hypothetical protein AVEN_85145-1 [Araneus ventricosus]|uniref:Uncharacterized protein n=1 Tax=Araneus ventricosus TaxID=182803 RepID=A0A4Y2PIC8_ARAVE|nr:hypothetical protein AVEN_63109-1 [Araneus ventricosus]GBN50687.1 hypothetical protein AVEN_85145-1 [Araneus ventricosus]